MTAPSANDFLLGSGVKSASFLNIGDSHIGTITKEPSVVQERDPQTKELKYWAKTNEPKWQLVVTIQTQERDPQNPHDDGLRGIYASGKKKAAIADAVRASGAKGLEVGGTLQVTYIGDAPLEQGQLRASKLYTAQYARPQFPVDQNPTQAGQAQPYQQQQVQQPQFQQPQQAQGFPQQQQQQFPQAQQPQAQGGFPQQQQFPQQQAAQPQQQQVQQLAPQAQGADVDAAAQQSLLNVLQQAQQGQAPQQG
jgi:hypothetical protein